MNHKFALPGLLAVVFFSFHLRYLPASLEDLDSINFALGVRHFDVAEHQPHPPGYPVYIAAAKAINAAIGNEVAALAALSVVAAALVTGDPLTPELVPRLRRCTGFPRRGR